MKVNIEFLKTNSYFSLLDESTLLTLARQVEIQEYQSNQIIYQEGDPADAFYIVVQGEVRQFTYDVAGNKIVLARLEKGDNFGDHAFSSVVLPRRSSTAETLLPTILYCIPRNVLLNLDKENQAVKNLLQTNIYSLLKTKINKLTESLSHHLHLAELLNSIQNFTKREIIYYQNDPAKNLFILLHGLVELRKYDQNYQLLHDIKLGIGEIFGNETLQDNSTYHYTAIAQENSQVIVINEKILKAHLNQIPFLLEYDKKLKKQYEFGQYGKAIQFRGQYLDMPTFVTLILLKDGRELICQQAIKGNLVLIRMSGSTVNKAIQFIQDDYQRELQLDSNNQLMGVLDIGIWDDTNQLLEAIIQKRQFTSAELALFADTGQLHLESLTAADKNLICTCMRVTKDEIEAAIKEGATTFEEIRKKTMASTVCGSCRPLIMEMLGSQAWISCQVITALFHNKKTATFRFKKLSQDNVSFIPGQHIVIRVDINNVWVRRSYTLTSLSEDPYFEVTVKLEEKGIFSPWIFATAEQQPIVQVAGPYGEFLLTQGDSPIICFAGGIGVTPFLSFCRYLKKHQPTRTFYLDYSASTAADFIYRDELEQITTLMDNSHIHFRETLIQGRILKHEIVHIIRSFPEADIYICGPAEFEKFLVKTLADIKVAPQQIHIEKFLQAGAPSGSPQMITF